MKKKKPLFKESNQEVNATLTIHIHQFAGEYIEGKSKVEIECLNFLTIYNYIDIVKALHTRMNEHYNQMLKDFTTPNDMMSIVEARNKMRDTLTNSVAQIGENITNIKPGSITYMTFEQMLRQEAEKKVSAI